MLTFSQSHRVTYAECTIGNHVYYARYLELLEEARGELFRSIGIPFLRLQEQDTAFPVIACQLLFKATARYDDQIRTEISIAELGRIRLAFRYRMTNQMEKLILEGTTRHVCSTLAEKPKRWPNEVAEALRPYLNAADHPVVRRNDLD